MQKQQGVSLSGLIVVIFITIVVLLLGFKLFRSSKWRIKLAKDCAMKTSALG